MEEVNTVLSKLKNRVVMVGNLHWLYTQALSELDKILHLHCLIVTVIQSLVYIAPLRYLVAINQGGLFGFIFLYDFCDKYHSFRNTNITS